MSVVSALISGLLFGAGLIVSGMSNPAKVQNFLDVTGAFDPSLILVMGGAVGVAFFGYRLASKRAAPLFESEFHGLRAKGVDFRLVTGAAIFGVGWGLGGFCPGPAIVSVSSGGVPVLVFTASMLAGLWLSRRLIATGKG